MGKKAKQMAALFMAGAVITGMTEMPLRVYAEEEPQKVEEKLIETDEYGNVYEIEPEIGLVEEDKSIRMARSSSAQIVNFNTKGAVVTEYTEAETGAPGSIPAVRTVRTLLILEPAMEKCGLCFQA